MCSPEDEYAAAGDITTCHFESNVTHWQVQHSSIMLSPQPQHPCSLSSEHCHTATCMLGAVVCNHAAASSAT